MTRARQNKGELPFLLSSPLVAETLFPQAFCLPQPSVGDRRSCRIWFILTHRLGIYPLSSGNAEQEGFQRHSLTFLHSLLKRIELRFPKHSPPRSDDKLLGLQCIRKMPKWDEPESRWGLERRCPQRSSVQRVARRSRHKRAEGSTLNTVKHYLLEGADEQQRMDSQSGGRRDFRCCCPFAKRHKFTERPVCSRSDRTKAAGSFEELTE